jgi:hypothetical protein
MGISGKYFIKNSQVRRWKRPRLRDGKKQFIKSLQMGNLGCPLS